ncbi:MAG: DUF1365 domain-containing protein [Lysobacteraceae bacterium]|nr:MAG: DUF1365 domain-containing protein [Xanthomonadaceae bacterium]
MGFPRGRYPQRRRGRPGAGHPLEQAGSGCPARLTGAGAGGVSPPLASAIYEGHVRHRRHAPRAHAFEYGMAQLYLDLDEVDTVFRDRWLWSVERANLASFQRRDFIGDPRMPLADAVRDRVLDATGERPGGPVRLLTHLRYAGLSFNPVSFYFCHDAAGVLHSIVAEITNTPWKERHAYVLPVAGARPRGRALHWSFDKAFHVSPFLPMQRRYDWAFTPPSHDLRVHMGVRDGADREFDATLALRRRPLDGPNLARVLLRYPLMTAQVVAGIHWQALRLWLKRTPVHDHPSTREIHS